MTKGRLDYIIELLYNACILNNEGINQIQKKKSRKNTVGAFCSKNIFRNNIYEEFYNLAKFWESDTCCAWKTSCTLCLLFFFLHITSLKCNIVRYIHNNCSLNTRRRITP